MKLAKGFAIATALVLGLGVVSAHAAGDAKKGEKVFRKCKACHTANKGGHGRVGPNLYGVVGRKAGTSNFKRYKALKGSDVVWTEANLDKWLTNPKKFIGKRTPMTLKLRKASQRADVIAYLKTLK